VLIHGKTRLRTSVYQNLLLKNVAEYSTLPIKFGGSVSYSVSVNMYHFVLYVGKNICGLHKTGYTVVVDQCG
jgi:hypothetical protein